MKRGDLKCYRHICPGIMILKDGLYICDTCGISALEAVRLSHEKEEIDLEDGDDFENVPDYDPVYDEEGSEVYCSDCITTPLKYHDEEYVCPRCDKVMDREDFFEYIGAEPMERCNTCKDNYAYCREYCELYNEF